MLYLARNLESVQRSCYDVDPHSHKIGFTLIQREHGARSCENALTLSGASCVSLFFCMEHLEIVHEHSGELVGSTLPRGEAKEQKAWCRSTNVYVLNSAGEVLCHQRSLSKESYPGYWITHLGGHVGVGETYETNAQKELEEEAGISVEPHTLIAWRTTRVPVSQLWTREFVTVVDREAHHFTPQAGEVECFLWKTPHEIIKEAREGVNWRAGTHDFWTEYHCLRAVLATAQAHGLMKLPRETHVWHQLATGA